MAGSFWFTALAAYAFVTPAVQAAPQGHYGHGHGHSAFHNLAYSAGVSYTNVPSTSTIYSTTTVFATGTAATATATATGYGFANVTAPGYGNASVTANTTLPSIIRGVNIGGWLVLEKWMNPDIFENTTAVDQYTFDATPGAAAKLQAHWDSYFTEDDVKQIASWGINALRIPIGYWAYDNNGTHYIKGADAYMERAVGWARKYGLKVLVDCHGSPGSQNGFDNSGQSGAVSWQADHNLRKSIRVLETMAAKYGGQNYSDVVFAIELVNEPISWDQNNFTLTQTWAQEAYQAVKSKATNKDLMVLMHDGFMGPSNWQQIGAAINGNSSLANSEFAIDVHLYQNQESSDSLLNQQQHIQKACNWTNSEFLPASSNLPVFAGEFSAQTNICAYPNGTTGAGSVCDVDGCQCSSNVPIQYWNPPLIAATRMFLEAELDAFEHSARGWFMWSYKGPGSWGLTNAVQYGLIGEKVTDRMYPNQCSAYF